MVTRCRDLQGISIRHGYQNDQVIRITEGLS
jgi:hypothetical protein